MLGSLTLLCYRGGYNGASETHATGWCHWLDKLKLLVKNNIQVVVCFLLNSDAVGSPRRKHTTFRIRRKFEMKNIQVVYMHTGMAVSGVEKVYF
jgi:hypothetical protein